MVYFAVYLASMAGERRKGRLDRLYSPIPI